MATLPKESRELLESAKRYRKQIADVKANPMLSEEYKLQFEAKQVASFEQTSRDVSAGVRARAERMRAGARDVYLSGQTEAYRPEEISIFRDYVAGADTGTLRSIAVGEGAVNEPAKVLALAAELRRRGEDVYADALVKDRPHAAEPWRESDQWKLADELVEQFEILDVTAKIAKQMDVKTVLTTGGPLLLTEDGPVPLALFFAESRPSGGSR
jgi:alpha-L-fucosidase